MARNTAAATRVAMPQRPVIRPAFTVQKLPGTKKMPIIFFDEKGKKYTKEVEEDAGFLVTLSKGHSVRIRTEADLRRLGLDKTIPLIDNEGDVVGEMPNNIVV